MNIESAGAVGAYVTGIDVRALTGAELESLREAFAQYGVLFIRGQQLSEQDHLDFAQTWGEINVNRFFASVDGYPQIAEVRKEREQKENIGGGWHTDHSYDQIPALGSMLYARVVPPVGGDTLFANTCSAYDSLSDGLKQTLSSMRACHSSRHVFGPAAPRMEGGRIGNPEAAKQDAVHPVVVRHPLSGRRSLYVNPGFTQRFEGWTQEESAPLLRMLYDHVVRPEHTVRLHWEVGTLAFWDNRATWHFAVNDYQGEKRLMHRITLEGVALAA